MLSCKKKKWWENYKKWDKSIFFKRKSPTAYCPVFPCVLPGLHLPICCCSPLIRVRCAESNKAVVTLKGLMWLMCSIAVTLMMSERFEAQECRLPLKGFFFLPVLTLSFFLILFIAIWSHLMKGRIFNPYFFWNCIGLNLIYPRLAIFHCECQCLFLFGFFWCLDLDRCSHWIYGR